MRGAIGVIAAGVVLAIVGGIVWAKAAATRAEKVTQAAYTEAFGWGETEVSSTAVYTGVGILVFGGLFVLVGVALAVVKAR